MLLKKNFIDKTFQDILTILVYFSVKGLVNTTVLINSFHFKLLKKKKKKEKKVLCAIVYRTSMGNIYGTNLT